MMNFIHPESRDRYRRMNDSLRELKLRRGIVWCVKCGRSRRESCHRSVWRSAGRCAAAQQ